MPGCDLSTLGASFGGAGRTGDRGVQGGTRPRLLASHRFSRETIQARGLIGEPFDQAAGPSDPAICNRGPLTADYRRFGPAWKLYMLKMRSSCAFQHKYRRI